MVEALLQATDDAALKPRHHQRLLGFKLKTQPIQRWLEGVFDLSIFSLAPGRQHHRQAQAYEARSLHDVPTHCPAHKLLLTYVREVNDQLVATRESCRAQTDEKYHHAS
eukprot:scaffold554596_cov29-Prasinocladus_malaysianus.AAC.1